jgi:hypothetical protein
MLQDVSNGHLKFKHSFVTKGMTVGMAEKKIGGEKIIGRSRQRQSSSRMIGDCIGAQARVS